MKLLMPAAIFFLILTIPSNLFLQLHEQAGYWQGSRIDYLIPKIYLSDLALLTVCGLLFFYHRQHLSQINKVLLVIIGLWLGRQLFTFTPLTSLLQVFRYLMVTATSILLYRSTFSDKTLRLLLNQALIWGLALAMTMQIGVGLYQFVAQKSLTVYSIWGEPQLLDQPGLARGDFYYLDRSLGTHFGSRILPYGTTAHPNILAGFLAVGVLINLYSQTCHFRSRLNIIPLASFKSLLITNLLLIFAIITIFLTASVSGVLTVIIGSALIISKRIGKFLTQYQLSTMIIAIIIGVPLALTMFGHRFTHDSIQRRFSLQRTALQLIRHQPWWGVGVNQFAANVEKFSSPNVLPIQDRQTPEIATLFLQPVHHAFLLFVAENGVLGMALLMVSSYLLFSQISIQERQHVLEIFLILSPIAAWDHYLLTIPTGMLMVLLFLSSQMKYIID